MKKNYQQIPLTEYINSAEPLLNYPIQRIGAIPFTSIQDISKTKDFKNATTAQLRLLKEIDSFWYKMMYWIAFYRIGNLDRRLAPLALKEFRSVEIFGELYAYQLELTIQLHRLSGYLPKQFTSPLNWWMNQMLEIKHDWYYSVFHPAETTKTQAVSKLNKSLQFMNGKVHDDESLKCVSFLTKDLIVRSQQFATRIGVKSKDFKFYFSQFNKIYKKYIDFTKGGNTKKGFRLAIVKGDFIYLSNQNSRRKIAIQ